MSTTIAENIATVQAHIAEACARAQRDPSQITLVAVSKKKPAQDILEAIAAGVQHFGENRVEESNEKIPQVQATTGVPITWHMVGHIQSRKSKEVPGLFDKVHSVDSVKLAHRLSSAVQSSDAAQNLAPLDVFIQINISGEERKSGFDAFNWQAQDAVKAQLWQDFRTITQLPGLNVLGLMTMAPIVDDMETTRPVFRALATLREALAEDFEHPLPELSMGMTDDYPVAIEEGATVVRIGRAIFGERQP